MIETGSRRTRWGDGGEWCNICVERKAVSIGLCEVCKQIPDPGCQLCISGVPQKTFEEAAGHLVSWDPGTAGWIPCSPADRKKIQEYEARLEEKR